MTATSLDVTQAILAKLVRAFLLIVGVLFALNAIGFDLTLLTVFGARWAWASSLACEARGHYIAGFTILIDKSIRLGDLITVDNRFGVVARVHRATSWSAARTASRRSSERDAGHDQRAITASQSRHQAGHSDQVAYTPTSDRRCASGRSRALEPSTLTDDKAPVAQLVQFTDSGIQLELIFWVRDPKRGHGVAKSDVGQRMLESLRENKVTIAYPRREVRVTREGRRAGTSITTDPEMDDNLQKLRRSREAEQASFRTTDPEMDDDLHKNPRRSLPPAKAGTSFAQRAGPAFAGTTTL